jgi:hypothetical protein
MKTGNLTIALTSLTIIAVGVHLASRYVVTPRAVQVSLFGGVLTSVGNLPTFQAQRGFSPWHQSWTYSLERGLPVLLQKRYGCAVGAAGISCRRCEPPRLGNMCFLEEVQFPDGTFAGARILDGALVVERGWGGE